MLVSNSMTGHNDEAYWANYYRSGAAPEVPSGFAQHVMGKYIQQIGGLTQMVRLVELGCGNGRDARFFASNGVPVLAVDQCVTPEQEDNSGIPLLEYKSGDFTQLEGLSLPADFVYSRFTLHSVDAAGQSRTLEWAHENLLPDGGNLFIETRGQKNEYYGLGEPVEGEEDAFVYEEHYRRFVEFDAFVAEIEAAGFRLVEASEDTGYAPFGDTDYHFIRVVAQKD